VVGAAANLPRASWEELLLMPVGSYEHTHAKQIRDAQQEEVRPLLDMVQKALVKETLEVEINREAERIKRSYRNR